MSQEIVRIGVGSAAIIGVTSARIDYTDDEGRAGWIDLAACAGPGTHTVGFRKTSTSPPRVWFTNDRRTRLEFATPEELYSRLLGPLRQVGWTTSDAS